MVAASKVPSASPQAASEEPYSGPWAATASMAEEASFSGEALAFAIAWNFQLACHPTADRSCLKDISAGNLFSIVSLEQTYSTHQ